MNEILKKLYVAAYFAFAAVTMYVVLMIFVTYPRINTYERAMFGEMIQGTAHKPFVNRMLLPATARVILSAMPADWKDGLTQEAGKHSFTRMFMKRARWDQNNIPEYVVACVLMYLALWGFFLSLRSLCRSVMDAPPWFVDLSGLLGLMALPPFFKYYSYLYDFPALFFFTLGLVLMARGKWIPFLVVFTISCFNKETTILLSLIFCLRFALRRRPPIKAFLVLGTVQLVSFVISRVVIHNLFLHNPGGLVRHHLLDNLHPPKPYTVSTYCAWLFVGLLVARRWKEKPEFLRDGSWILWPLLGATFVFGWFNELRDYYEALPIFFLLMMWEVGKILEIPLASASGLDHRAATS